MCRQSKMWHYVFKLATVTGRLDAQSLEEERVARNRGQRKTAFFLVKTKSFWGSSLGSHFGNANTTLTYLNEDIALPTFQQLLKSLKNTDTKFLI